MAGAGSLSAAIVEMLPLTVPDKTYTIVAVNHASETMIGGYARAYWGSL